MGKTIGYTSGVFDLFHIGHLNLLKNARDQCDYLIVSVSVDELVAYKGKHPVIPFEERIEIIRAIRYVDEAIPQISMDKIAVWKQCHFNKIFVGDDWKNTEKWNAYEQQFQQVGVEVVYFPYTVTTSSTLINETLLQLREEK